MGQIVHGDARRGHITRLHKIWSAIKYRCYGVNGEDYSYYGGRGIQMCPEWKNDYSIFREWALINGYNDKLSIDRIDVNGNYEPNNCRWVDMHTQAQNKRNIPLYTYKGETHCMTEWARLLNIPRGLLKDRIIKLGWDFESAIKVPIRQQQPRSSDWQEHTMKEWAEILQISFRKLTKYVYEKHYTVDQVKTLLNI